ncbi:MAG: DUF3565 domain-containing protein [Nannocystaceae bacterium]
MPSAPAVVRRMVGVARDDGATVVVSLDCGHQRHVRHRPPLHEHPWVVDDAQCRERIGGQLECFACGQRRLPEHARVHRSTRVFDEHDVPRALRSEHTTKDGVWGRLVVEQGELVVEFAPPLSARVPGRPQTPVIIPPSVVHRVVLAGPVRFRVELLSIQQGDG